MSLFIPHNEQQSDLQKRIAAELQEKARAKAKEAEVPDGVNDSAFIKGTRQTSRRAWMWILAIIIVIVAVIVLTITLL